jgi:glucosamine kinase
MGHVIGVDAGGSHTRAVLVHPGDGGFGTGRAAGANPTALGVDSAVAQLEVALRQAIGSVPPTSVSGCVIGMAGGPTAGAALIEGLDRLAERLGLDCGCTLVSDTEVAFASGTSATDGILLLAGTGAATVEIRDRRAFRNVDGNGWLLGDGGSGFWLGRQGVRAVIAQWDGRGGQTSLTETVTQALHTEATVEALQAAVYGQSPLRLARLAPLVTAAASGGDEVAVRIVRRAADLLLGNISALNPAGKQEVVLAGGVLLAGGPITELVIDGLRERFGLRARPAGDGALGAAALALSFL